MAEFLFLSFSQFLATFFLLLLCENVTTSVSVCYQAFVEELVIRAAPAIAVVFSLNFCTGIKRVLALKL